MAERNRVVRCLTIAGSDSGGGAGIQADLKTFSSLGVHGMSVITAVTAQNTHSVIGVQLIDCEIIEQQIRAVLDDIGADAIKIGMLGSAEIVRVVSKTLRDYESIPIILDPVMLSKGGQKLLIDDEAVEALKKDLIPMARLITPNYPAVIDTLPSARDYARELRQNLGCAATLLKGGHLHGIPDENTVVDILCDGDQTIEFASPRIVTDDTHGTGCTLAAAITAFIARGISPLHVAVSEAKSYIQGAIQNALKIGSGHGCLHHMWQHCEIANHPIGCQIISEDKEINGERLRFSDVLWRSTNTDALLQRILEHPFLVGLTSGTLQLETFRRYIVQDALYLRHYSRGLALIGARAYSSDRISEVYRSQNFVTLCDFAQGAIEAELAMHRTWLHEWKITVGDENMSPTCILYTSYLMATAYDRPFEEAVVAYLPCFWIYHRVGQELAKCGSPNPVYQRWIDQYASDEFGAEVEKMKSIVDQTCAGLAPQRVQEISEHFKRTCQMEWMFWDAAFRDQKWPT